jgi:hypothetical protein
MTKQASFLRRHTALDEPQDQIQGGIDLGDDLHIILNGEMLESTKMFS